MIYLANRQTHTGIQSHMAVHPKRRLLCHTVCNAGADVKVFALEGVDKVIRQEGGVREIGRVLDLSLA